MKKSLVAILMISMFAFKCKDDKEKAKIQLPQKVTNGIIDVFYKDGASKEQAEKLAAHVNQLLTGLDTVRKTVHLKEKGDTMILRLTVRNEEYKSRYLSISTTPEEAAENFRKAQQSDLQYLGIANDVSENVFSGRPVNIELTNYFNMGTLRSIPFKKLAPENN